MHKWPRWVTAHRTSFKAVQRDVKIGYYPLEHQFMDRVFPRLNPTESFEKETTQLPQRRSTRHGSPVEKLGDYPAG